MSIDLREPAVIAEIDQAAARMISAAEVLGQFRKKLKTEGFTKEESFTLVQDYFDGFRGINHEVEE